MGHALSALRPRRVERATCPSACPLPSTHSARARDRGLRSVGSPWLYPAFPPSCPFRFAIVRAVGRTTFVRRFRRYYESVRLAGLFIGGLRRKAFHLGPRSARAWRGRL